jgi:segregation and condensation protein A
MGVLVEINRYSGPLDLLLHLIRKEEMDIFDINIHEITKQYLDSIRQMKKLNLELAGDFIAMASTLIQIKARMLVPQYNEQGEVIETEDPRRDLVQRLLEYQMYQDASKSLYSRPLVGRDVWLRGRKEEIETPDSDIIVEEDNALYALILNYRIALRRVKKAIHKVAASLKSVKDRIWELRERLRPGLRVEFSSLIKEETPELRKGELLITFLSILELAKMGFVSLFQGDNFSEIHIEAKNEITKDVMSRVETYDAKDNVGGTSEIWVSDEESALNEDVGPKPETQARASELDSDLYTTQPATDEEILLEEQKYEQEI